MSYLRTVSIIAVTAVCAPSAYADVTADEVWEAIVASGQMMGYDVSGSTSKSGDTLSIETLMMAVKIPEGSVNVSMGGMAITENSDGTAVFSYAEQMPLTVTVDAAEIPEPIEISMMMSISGSDTIVSGTPKELTFSDAGDDVVIRFTDFAMDLPDDAPEDFTFDGTFDMSMSGYQGNYVLSLGDALSFVSTFSADTVSANMAADIVAEGEAGNVVFDFKSTNLSGDSSLTLPTAVQSVGMMGVLQAGGASSSNYSFGASELALGADTPEGAFTLNSSADGAEIASNMADGEMAFSGSKSGIKMAVSSNMIPFPELTAQIAQAGFGLAMPVAAADEESDMALNFALRGLEISDMIWGMVDPAGQLPRDPANIALDLTGSGRWFVDIFDPQVAENLTGLPGQVSAVQINDLEVSAAGAALTGEGAFTFDFTDFTTFPGSPRPAGSVNLELVGINGLMDTLVSMGLLPQEQVMGARMMMGIFATPGEGEDTLKSELTVTDDGQVLANGQRLR